MVAKADKITRSALEGSERSHLYHFDDRRVISPGRDDGAFRAKAELRAARANEAYKTISDQDNRETRKRFESNSNSNCVDS
jgi:hypothetical protein